MDSKNAAVDGDSNEERAVKLFPGNFPQQDVMPQRSGQIERPAHRTSTEVASHVSNQTAIAFRDGSYQGANIASTVYYVTNKTITAGETPEKKRKREDGAEEDSGIKYLNDIMYFNQNAPISKPARVFEGGVKSEAVPTEPVAVKLLQFIELEDAKPLIDEANAIRRIQHPNVVKYIHADMSVQYMSVYLVMEMCMKLNLYDHVRSMRRESRRFSFRDCKTAVKQLSSALKLIHELGILHRDIKPSNILLSKDGRNLKLTDFSLAKPSRPGRSVTADSSKRIGTDGWRAPEAILRDKHTKKSDIYSLGLSLYFVWSIGEQAFGDDPDLVNYNIKMNMNRNLAGISFQDPEEVRPLRQVLEKMLEFQERNRITAGDLACERLCTNADCELSNWEGEVYQPPSSSRGSESRGPKSSCLVVFDRRSYSLYAFEPSEKSWHRMQSIDSTMRGRNMTAVCDGDHIYAVLEDKRVFSIKYTNRNSVWESEDDMLLEHGDRPPTTLLEGYIYAVGQSQPSPTDPREGERFDLKTRTWSKIPLMRTKRLTHSLVACNGGLYSIGGKDCSVQPHPVEAAVDGEKFDPVTEVWSPIGKLNGPRYGASATALNDKIYIFGGARQGRIHLSEAEVYDTNTDTWTKIAEMNIPRCYLGAATVNEKIYAVDGHGISPLTVEEYDPQKDMWEIADTVTEMMAWPSACVSVQEYPTT